MIVNSQMVLFQADPKTEFAQQFLHALANIIKGYDRSSIIYMFLNIYILHIYIIFILCTQ
jgi:hypothetical protein